MAIGTTVVECSRVAVAIAVTIAVTIAIADS